MPALTHGRAAKNYNFAGPSNPNTNSKTYKVKSSVKSNIRRNALPGGVGTSNLAKRAYKLHIKCCTNKNIHGSKKSV
jgi:hypothetical protein